MRVTNLETLASLRRATWPSALNLTGGPRSSISPHPNGMKSDHARRHSIGMPRHPAGTQCGNSSIDVNHLSVGGTAALSIRGWLRVPTSIDLIIPKRKFENSFGSAHFSVSNKLAAVLSPASLSPRFYALRTSYPGPTATTSNASMFTMASCSRPYGMRHSTKA